jgi:hypothetical protein
MVNIAVVKKEDAQGHSEQKQDTHTACTELLFCVFTKNEQQ